MKRGVRFRIGPATTLAIAGAIVVATVRFPAWQREAAQTHQFDELRAQIARRASTAPVAPQNTDTLWQNRAQLRLSAAQQKSLAVLRAQESRATAVLQRETDVEAHNFRAWMNQHTNGAAMGDIQNQAASYSAKSGELAAMRREFWNRALQLLSAAQRAQIEARTTSASGTGDERPDKASD